MLWFMGFIVTFTLGGVTGVVMSIPAADFQLHNSLFLVAHFHNMIIGGVVFGFFAGITYWFPKIFGFKLNERIGTYAFWCWLIGFLLAFVPLYILGFMGATRRLDHYDASLGWQGLFVVAGIGVLVIGLGVALQLFQLFYSIWKRKENLDTTGDPWNGRTLEWTTTSPPPVYNFATMPAVTERDPFWEQKQSKAKKQPPKYEAIHLPKNTPMGMYVAAFGFIASFAFVWHIYWLAAIGILGVIITLVIRLSDDDTEYTLPASKVAEMEAAAKRRYA
jgi:cytochrome o ubiquinol oxidase subunit 1